MLENVTLNPVVDATEPAAVGTGLTVTTVLEEVPTPLQGSAFVVVTLYVPALPCLD